ncbi:MAG TPA: hypothetical protein PLI51_10210, partial [bacterium]|nr:hypothetical protein [bacterium]
MIARRQTDRGPGAVGAKALTGATVLAAAGAAVLYLLLFWFCDRPVDLWVRAHWAGTWVFSAGTLVSELATGEYLRLGAAAGFIAVAVFDPGLKRSWARNLLCVCLAFAVATVVGEGLKYLLGRCRPVLLFDEG